MKLQDLKKEFEEKHVHGLIQGKGLSLKERDVLKYSYPLETLAFLDKVWNSTIDECIKVLPKKKEINWTKEEDSLCFEKRKYNQAISETKANLTKLKHDNCKNRTNSNTVTRENS
jgi:hypothetical protein